MPAVKESPAPVVSTTNDDGDIASVSPEKAPKSHRIG